MVVGIRRMCGDACGRSAAAPTVGLAKHDDPSGGARLTCVQVKEFTPVETSVTDSLCPGQRARQQRTGINPEPDHMGKDHHVGEDSYSRRGCKAGQVGASACLLAKPQQELDPSVLSRFRFQWLLHL